LSLRPVFCSCVHGSLHLSASPAAVRCAGRTKVRGSVLKVRVPSGGRRWRRGGGLRGRRGSVC